MTLSEKLAWQLACKSNVGVNPARNEDRHAPLVRAWIVLHNGTAEGFLVEAFGRTTNDASHNLKQALLDWADTEQE